jgi:hypothetical protein
VIAIQPGDKSCAVLCEEDSKCLGYVYHQDSSQCYLHQPNRVKSFIEAKITDDSSDRYFHKTSSLPEVTTMATVYESRLLPFQYFPELHTPVTSSNNSNFIDTLVPYWIIEGRTQQVMANVIPWGGYVIGRHKKLATDDTGRRNFVYMPYGKPSQEWPPKSFADVTATCLLDQHPNVNLLFPSSNEPLLPPNMRHSTAIEYKSVGQSLPEAKVIGKMYGTIADAQTFASRCRNIAGFYVDSPVKHQLNQRDIYFLGYGSRDFDSAKQGVQCEVWWFNRPANEVYRDSDVRKVLDKPKGFTSNTETKNAHAPFSNSIFDLRPGYQPDFSLGVTLEGGMAPPNTDSNSGNFSWKEVLMFVGIAGGVLVFLLIVYGVFRAVTGNSIETESSYEPSYIPRDHLSKLKILPGIF